MKVGPSDHSKLNLSYHQWENRYYNIKWFFHFTPLATGLRTVNFRFSLQYSSNSTSVWIINEIISIECFQHDRQCAEWFMWIPKLVFLLTLGGGSPTSTQRQFFSQGLESTTKCLFLIPADIALFFYFGLWMTSKRLLSVWGCHMRIVFYSILLWEDSSFYQPVSFLRKVIIPLVLSLMWFANVSCVVHLEVSIDQKASQVNTFHIFHIWFNVRGVDLPINLL